MNQTQILGSAFVIDTAHVCYILLTQYPCSPDLGKAGGLEAGWPAGNHWSVLCGREGPSGGGLSAE